LEEEMNVTLRLKNPAYGCTKDAWDLIWQSLEGSDREGWTNSRIHKDLANGEGKITIPFPNEEKGKIFIKTLVDKDGLNHFDIL
jgi:hypothetical protein